MDNCSSDDTVAVARALGADIIEMPGNAGFSKANNVGFMSASTDYVCFANPDIRVDHGSLDELARRIDQLSGLCCPQLMNPDGSLQPNGRGFPVLWNKILHRLRPESTVVREQYVRINDSTEPLAACWAMGAAIAASRTTFESIGGWDDWFFLYYEDKDICLRAWEAGYSVNILGSVRWPHGWARETTRFEWAPWRREFSSMRKFYSRYPAFLLGNWAARIKYPAIANAMRRPFVTTR